MNWTSSSSNLQLHGGEVRGPSGLGWTVSGEWRVGDMVQIPWSKNTAL